MSNEPLELTVDEFLEKDPDCPVFGLNLACAYPFPTSVDSHYRGLAARLEELDEGVYVYPLWETHVTIMTFLSFRLHLRPSAQQLEELRSCINPIIRVMQTLFDTVGMEHFKLEFHPPVLTHDAAILPVSNPTGEIAQIRRHASRRIEGNKSLHEKLLRGGMNVPGIVHSTIMRFKKVPADLPRFAAGFAKVAAATKPFAATAQEIYLTTETKPYMRQGGIVHRFELAGTQHRD
jgi:hypothetical protein